MTKDQYLEMCSQMGTKPILAEIPIEYEDLAPEIQLALSVWASLSDDIDYFNGTYHGKKLQGITEVFTIMDIPKNEWRELYDFISIINSIKVKLASKKKPTPKPPM